MFPRNKLMINDASLLGDKLLLLDVFLGFDLADVFFKLFEAHVCVGATEAETELVTVASNRARTNAL